MTEHDLVLGGIGPTDDPVGTEVDQLDLEVGVGVGPVDREIERIGARGVYHRRRLDRELGHVGDLLDGIRDGHGIGAFRNGGRQVIEVRSIRQSLVDQLKVASSVNVTH